MLYKSHWKCFIYYWFTLIDCCFHGIQSSFVPTMEEGVVQCRHRETVVPQQSTIQHHSAYCKAWTHHTSSLLYTKRLWHSDMAMNGTGTHHYMWNPLGGSWPKHKQRGIQPGFDEIIPIRSQHFPPEATPIYYFDSETFLLRYENY